MSDALLEYHIAQRNAQMKEANLAMHEHYLPVLQERSERYAAHVAAMTISLDMVAWSLAMGRQFGRYVRVSFYIADWFTALLLVRYGEEPDAARSTDPNFKGWPLEFDDIDRQRAEQLLRMTKWNETVTLLPREIPLDDQPSQTAGGNS